MAGETTTTKKAAAPAGSKSADAGNQSAAPGNAGQPTGDTAAPNLSAGADSQSAQTGAEQLPTDAPAPAPARGEPKIVAIEVISRRDGFWRAGRQWEHAPQTVPIDDLTEQQLDEILEEPQLITRMIAKSELA